MSIPWQIVVESWDRQQNSAATSLKTPVTAQLPDTPPLAPRGLNTELCRSRLWGGVVSG